LPQALRAAEEQELQRVAWEEVEAARLVEERRREEERQRLEAERLEVEQKEFEANFGRIMEICQTFIGKQATATAQLLSNAGTDRKCLKTGLLQKRGDARKQERFFILMNDVFLFTKQVRRPRALANHASFMIVYGHARPGGEEGQDSARCSARHQSRRVAGCCAHELPSHQNRCRSNRFRFEVTMRLTHFRDSMLSLS
jgi:hypothetical protein